VGAANKGLPLGHACSSNTSFFLGKGPEGRLHTRWRCTRTSWAVALILAVVVVSAVVGTGVAVGKGHAAAAGDQRATRSAEANALGGTNVSGVANGTGGLVQETACFSNQVKRVGCARSASWWQAEH
jgi:hypothetical protein